MPDFDIKLQYISGLPDGYLDDFKELLKTSDLCIIEEERPPGEVMAAFDWIALGAVTIYLGNIFFEPILKRAGNDFADTFYPLLKSGVVNLVKKLFLRDRIKLTKITISGPIDAPENSYFSIQSKTKNGKRVRFVFLKILTEEQYDICIEQLFILIKKHHASQDDTDILSSQIKKLPENRQIEIFLVYNAESNIWEVKDPIQEAIERQSISKIN